MRPFSPARDALLIMMYLGGASLAQCGARFGISHVAARQVLQKHGIQRRRPGRPIGERARRLDRFVRKVGETIVLEAPEAPAIIARAMALGSAPMDKPTPKELREATGISPSYASMILSEDPEKSRTPPRPLAIYIFRVFGWRHPTIAELSIEEMEMLERIEPYQPREAA